MTGKIGYAIAEEKVAEKKQIGCAGGLFQLFGRHFHGSGGRRKLPDSSRRFPSGQNGNNHGIVRGSSLHTGRTQEGMKKERVSHDDGPKTSSPSSSSFSSNPKLSSLQRGQKLQEHAVRNHSCLEVHGLSVKTAKKDNKRQTLKHVDSPRPPPQNSNFFDRRILDANERLRLLDEMGEAARKHSEKKHGSLPYLVKDVHRFSCDGKEMKERLGCKAELHDLPRLSLDSRISLVQNCVPEQKSCFFEADLEEEKKHNCFSREGKECESNNKPSCNIVAKLMGMEAISLPAPAKLEHLKKTRSNEEAEKEQNSTSPNNLRKDPLSPRKSRADSAKNSIKSLKYPKEQAPWKQVGGRRGSQAPPKARENVEKRVAQLMLEQSKQEYISLKQMIEAMEKSKNTCSNRSLHRRPQESLKSTIVIMKPAKHIEKAINSSSSMKISNQCTNFRRLTGNIPEVAPSEPMELKGVYAEKQSGLEEQACQMSPSSCSSKSRRQLRKEPAASTSARRKAKPKPICLRPSDSKEHYISSNISENSCADGSGSTSEGNSIKQNSNKQRESGVLSTRDGSMEEPMITSPEQPSPVSVLDATFSNDDFPCFTKANNTMLYNDIVGNSSEKVNHEQRENDQEHEDETIAQGPKLDGQHNSEISSSVGNINDFGHGAASIHPKSHKAHSASTKKSQAEDCKKTQRNLAFDFGNEIIANKLGFEDSSLPESNELMKRGETQDKQLLQELLCSEINWLEEESSLESILQKNFVHQSKHWTLFSGGISEIALDIESLILNEILSEICY